MFIKHILANAPLPPIDPSTMIEFVVAGNGVFVRARRKGLEAMVPVARCEIRGLRPVRPYVRIVAGKVPLIFTQRILAEFQRDLPNESLIWLRHEAGNWQMVRPRQIQEENAVRPLDPFDPEGVDAFLDVHSHNTMPPFFSTDDDRDETGFRLFAVFGLLDKKPCVTARIGIYGYYWHLNAGNVFVLPDGIQDAVGVMLEQTGMEPAEMEGWNEPADGSCTRP